MTLAEFNFEQGTTEELARCLEMCKVSSPVPVLVIAKAHHENAELGRGSLHESTLSDGSKVCTLTLLFV